ncbi:hypothetical protein B0H19DRAFT_1244353 [Mycena capillaripes]|nr:hypothetical protein B0H19DRAFT_1244353 [Mycena capillaripes]
MPGVFFWLRRRRQRLGRVHPFMALSSPINMAASRKAQVYDAPGITRIIRRQHLENELCAALETMAEIRELEEHTVSRGNATQDSGAGRLFRFMPMWNTAIGRDGKTQDLEAQLDAARERNERLAVRIRELEAQMHYEWAKPQAPTTPVVFWLWTSTALMSQFKTDTQ